MELVNKHDLCHRYLVGSLSLQELQQLLNYLQSEEDHQVFQQEMLQALNIETYPTIYNTVQVKQLFQQLLKKVKTEQPAKPSPVYFLRKTWLRYAAAILLLCGTGAYFYFNRVKQSVVATVKPVKNNIAPGANKAVLTLADGRTIMLDSVANGQLATQGNVRIVKLANGQVAYTIRGRLSTNNNDTLSYNTITTPRGGQYQLILPDGTKVWLNAVSSITYPVAFSDNRRNVNVSGEAYFEVTKDKARPFQVTVNDMKIEVLGTSFNMNAYADEASARTTLLEGSIKVVKGAAAIVLTPGQQAIVKETRQSPVIEVEKNIDVAQVMAWKNGFFSFNKLPLHEVLRQLSRWYDVDVVYPGVIPQRKFGGEIQRDLSLSEVLDVLRETGMRFSMEGRKLIVLE